MGKRIFDFVLALFGIILFSLFLLVPAILIKLFDRGPVFFRQTRVGLGGKPFKIFKFRTMRVDAEKMGKQITVGKDPRITRIGHILRETKLDELPQLFNVLIGEMSFVGPRPEVPYYVDKYNEEQRKVLELRPGITDLASIKYRSESEILAESDNPEATYIATIMPDKIKINLEYANHATVLTDIGVIFSTIFHISKKTN